MEAKPRTLIAGLAAAAVLSSCGAPPQSRPSQVEVPTLPGLIDGIEIESQDHVPPIMDSKGNLYRVTEDYKANGNRPRFMKAANGGRTWREQDAAHRADHGDTEAGWVVQAGKSIWFVWETSAVYLTRFRTSDHPTRPDTYAISSEVVDDLPNEPDHNQYASMVANRDGSLWIAYGVSAGSGQKIVFKKRLGSGRYSHRRILDNRDTDTTAPRLVRGARGVTHIFYKDVADNHILWRQLTASGRLSAARRVDSGGTHPVVTPLTNAVYYNDHSTPVLTIAFADPSGILTSVTIRGNRIGPEQRVSSTPVMIDPEVVTNDAAVAHLAVSGATVHALWSDAANGHVYRDVLTNRRTWGADTRLVNTGPGTARQAQYVYGNVLTWPRGRRILAFTYDIGPHADDDSNIHYNRVVLSP